MEETLKIVVDKTPSLNKLHSNRWAMLNWKKKFIKQLRNFEFLCPKQKVKKILVIKRYGSRIYDQDNFIGGLKPLIDAMKEKGIVYDDTEKWLQLKAEQVKCRRNEEKVEIFITIL